MNKLLCCLCAAVIILAGCTNNSQKQNATTDSLSAGLSTTEVDVASLTDTIAALAAAFSRQDSAFINRHIHPNTGIYVIYRPGVSDMFERLSRLDFSNPTPSYYAYESYTVEHPLEYGEVPTYDCGKEAWSKEGFFCDTTQRPQELQRILAFTQEFDQQAYTASEAKALKTLEETSWRVVVTGKHPLIFHISKIAGSWYLTVLDRAYAGCDA